MKGTSEAQVRAALNNADLNAIVYKPPDDARNWKPADFLVWWQDGSAMIEVKQSPGKFTFPIKELRTSQLLAIRRAQEVGLPYYLVIWWPKLQTWTISKAGQVSNWIGDHPEATSLDYGWLNSIAGMDCTTRDLAPILRSVLLGEVD